MLLVTKNPFNLQSDNFNYNWTAIDFCTQIYEFLKFSDFVGGKESVSERNHHITRTSGNYQEIDKQHRSVEPESIKTQTWTIFIYITSKTFEPN